jgi:acyl-CoA-binding protein
MLGFQAKSAKNNAAKDELSLLQMKLAAAKDNLRNASDSDDQNKYIAMVKKLQGK